MYMIGKEKGIENPSGLADWWNPWSWGWLTRATSSGGEMQFNVVDLPGGEQTTTESTTSPGWLNQLFGKLFGGSGKSSGSGSSFWSSLFSPGQQQQPKNQFSNQPVQSKILGMSPLVFTILAVAVGGGIMWYASRASGGQPQVMFAPPAPEPRTYRSTTRRAPTRPTAKRSKKASKGRRR